MADFFAQYTDKFAHLGCAFIFVCAGALPRKSVRDGIIFSVVLSLSKEVADIFSIGFDFEDIIFNLIGIFMALTFVEIWRKHDQCKEAPSDR